MLVWLSVAELTLVEEEASLFLKDIEYQVLHYFHSLPSDNYLFLEHNISFARLDT